MEIKPNLGVDEINFSSSRQSIRNTLSMHNVELFNRGPDEQIPADYFKELGLFVYYDQDDICEALEFANEIDLRFEGVNFFKLPYYQVEAFFTNIDEGIEVDESGFICFELGIGIYAPSKSENINCDIESIIIFRKGYYD